MKKNIKQLLICREGEKVERSESRRGDSTSAATLKSDTELSIGVGQ